jgi:hypothetical protein
VHHPLAVRAREGARDLDRVTERKRQREGSLLQSRGERLAFEILHHQVVDAVLLPDVVEMADVRIAQAGDRAGLSLEALPPFGVCGKR